MNYSIIRFILGRMLRIEGLVLLFPALVSLIYQEHSGLTFILTAAILMALSLLLGKKPKNMVFYAKEGFIIVALAWILWSAFGGDPSFCGCVL